MWLIKDEEDSASINMINYEYVDQGHLDGFYRVKFESYGLQRQKTLKIIDSLKLKMYVYTCTVVHGTVSDKYAIELNNIDFSSVFTKQMKKNEGSGSGVDFVEVKVTVNANVCDCGAVKCGHDDKPGPAHSDWCRLMEGNLPV